MQMRCWLVLWVFALVSAASCAGTIQYTVTNLGGDEYSYDYTLSGFTLLQGQEIDIRFDPTLYSALSNEVAGSEVSLLVLQPNNPQGTFGDYSITALLNDPSFSGTYSVEFVWLGQGVPGSQVYYINTYDSNGMLQNSSLPAYTVLAGAVPEPDSFSFTAAALLIGGVGAALRTRWARAWR